MQHKKTIHELYEEAKNSNPSAITELQAMDDNSDALTILGGCYYQGYGVAQNYPKAFECYSKAAEHNHDLAMLNLGLMYEYGLGVEQNPLLAESWYQKSLQHCKPENKSINQSEERLKSITPEKKSEFLTRQKYREKTWFELTDEAKKGDKLAVDALEVLSVNDRNALSMLGSCYYNGWGVAKDFKKAVEIYEKAAEQGCYTTKYSLGNIFRHGVSPIKIDIPRAIKYYIEVANSESEYQKAAREDLTHLRSFVTYLQRHSKEPLSEIKFSEIYDEDLSSNFGEQVVVDLMNPTFFSDVAAVLVKKWNSSRKNACHVLRGEDLFANTEQLNVLKNKDAQRIRIYLVGHSWVSYNDLEDDNNNKISVDKIAESLAHFIKDENVVINLVACCAGKGKNADHSDSFGAKLHAALFKLTQRDIPVVARTSLCTAFAIQQQKATFKLSRLEDFKENYDAILALPEWQQTLPSQNFYVNKQPHSKVVFKMDEGKQICRDAYQEKIAIKKWKEYALYALAKAERKTSSGRKKNLLLQWRVLLSSGKAEEVYRLMEKELRNVASPLRSKMISRLFKSRTMIEDITDVVRMGQEIFNNPEVRYNP